MLKLGVLDSAKIKEETRQKHYEWILRGSSCAQNLDISLQDRKETSTILRNAVEGQLFATTPREICSTTSFPLEPRSPGSGDLFSNPLWLLHVDVLDTYHVSQECHVIEGPPFSTVRLWGKGAAELHRDDPQPLLVRILQFDVGFVAGARQGAIVGRAEG